MPVPLKSRADLKAAGRAFGREAADALATIVVEHHPDGITPERLEQLFAVMVGRMVATADDYRAMRIPELWVRKFVRSFYVGARERCRHYGLAFPPSDGTV